MGFSPTLDRVFLPALREDISLQAAPPGRDGAPYWNLYDPVRNSFFRVGWLEFEMLSRWREGMPAEDLSAAVCSDTPLDIELEDVLSLVQFLQHNELIRTSSRGLRDVLLKTSASRKLSAWKWLLHHYLFFRIPLLKPEAFLLRTLPHLGFLFRPSFFFWIGVLSLVGLVRVANQWEEFSKTFMYFFSWEGAVYYGLALALTKSVHEMAHAYTAKHYGLRVPTMGIAFMVMWPLLYTDTSEGWKLASRRARLAIDGAGVAAELCLAGIALFSWSFLPDGPLKSAAYVLAAVTWISTLLINLNPFMRFDGYYLLMDAVDMPNVQQRSFAFGKWQLRRWILGVEKDIPEPEFESKKFWLLGYAYTTWLYRLVLFTGIAIAVYHFFFKAAGIALFAVEIGWFVVLPIWREAQMWWDMRKQWQGNFASWRSIALFALMLLWLALPWHFTIDAEGYLQADPYTSLYPPTAARLEKIMVREGQSVHRGDVLFVLESPESQSQLTAIDSRIEGIKAQLAGSVGSTSLFRKIHVLEQELAVAEAERSAEIDDMDRLKVTAPHDGIFRDLGVGLYPGAWVAAKRKLGLVLGRDGTSAQVYVNETEVERIKVGAHAKLVTHRPDAESLDAVVTGIDETATRNLPEPMLASPYGGQIAVRQEARGGLFPNEAIYRVTLKAPGYRGDGQMTPLVAHIDGGRSSLLGRFFRWGSGILIRESGL
ncbi:MAG: biotin/lipoyl-binding protein [Burkholderiales bacterium]|nr:biotin/lipoyl-binding protein [Burkholderiales bacterium]